MTWLNALFAMAGVIVAVYYRRKDFADSRLGRHILTTNTRLLRWRADADVVKELVWLGKFFGATALLCISATLLGQRALGTPMPETALAALYSGFASISIYSMLDPNKLIRKFALDIGAIMIFGPGFVLVLDGMQPDLAMLPVYAKLWQPVVDLSAFQGITLAACIAVLHAAVFSMAFVVYGLMLAFIPALLYAALSDSKRLCTTALGLSNETIKDAMIVYFLIDTIYGVAAITTR